MRFVPSASPLLYDGARARRVTLIDDGAPAPGPTEVYFAEGAVGFVNGRKAVVPAALPGATAFVDYSVRGDGAVFIHYVATRWDLRGKGYGALLLDHFLRSIEKDGVPSVDFGKIMHDAMERLFRRWLRLSEEGKYKPRVYGKIW